MVAHYTDLHYTILYAQNGFLLFLLFLQSESGL